MEQKKFIRYIRVSTAKQGRSGLGLEAQQQICQQYIDSENGMLVKEFKDVESGTHRDRPGLLAAIDFAKSNDCTIVIAKLDRLARDVEFTFKVLNTGVSIHFCDMPSVNTLVLGMFATVAQYERELTSKRTKDALAAKKAQGVKLGAKKGIDMTKANRASVESKKATARAKQENKIIWTVLSDYVKANDGKIPTTNQYMEASQKLNIMGIQTPSGLDMTPERCRSCYFNLKKFMEVV